MTARLRIAGAPGLLSALDGAAAVLVLTAEGGGADTCGMSLTALRAACPLVLHHPVDPGALTTALAQHLVDALAAAPAPTLIVCKTGRRAEAVAALFAGAQLRASATDVIAAATARSEKWVESQQLRGWVAAYSMAQYAGADRSKLVFRQLFDSASSTFTYLLADSATREAVLIDPVLEHVDRDAELLGELDLSLKFMLNTHCHADHVTGTGAIKERMAAMAEPPQSAIGAASGATADVQLHEGDRVRFGSRWLEVLETPGHTEGCCSFLLDDGTKVFTGDALLIRGCGRTDFQGGCAAMLFDSVTSKLFRLNAETAVYPAHDYKGRTSSSIGEERRHNARLTKSRPEFVQLMADLELSTPKLIDVAVPANMRCGVHDD